MAGCEYRCDLLRSFSILFTRAIKTQDNFSAAQGMVVIYAIDLRETPVKP